MPLNDDEKADLVEQDFIGAIEDAYDQLGREGMHELVDEICDEEEGIA